MSKLEIIDVHPLNEKLLKSTSKGNQRKWKIDNLWVKGDFLGYEGVAEELCSRVIELCDIPLYLKTPYTMCQIKDTSDITVLNGCYSFDFSDNQSHITLNGLLSLFKFDKPLYDGGNDFRSVIDGLSRVINELTDIDDIAYLEILIALDALLVNEDRHLNNFLFLINEYGEITPSPYFDFGLSLLSDLKDYSEYNTPIQKTLKAMKPKLFGVDNIRLLNTYDGKPFISLNSLNNFISNADKDRYGRALDVLRVSVSLNKSSKIFYENHVTFNKISTDFKIRD